MADELIRIGQRVLKAREIPFHEECWIRSGLSDIEIQLELKSLLRPGDGRRELAAVIQVVILGRYLDELITAGKIEQADRGIYMRKWAGESFNWN